MQQLYASGTQHFLQVYFQAVLFDGPFYIGLGQGAIPEGISKTLADVVEVTGAGYERLAITRNATTGSGWSLTNNVVSSPVLTFTNTSMDPSGEWDPADYLFLTLSPSGTSSPNVMLGAVELDDTLQLMAGQSEDLVFSFSLFY